ncbi:MAG: hypothetical protein KDB71_01705 [Mycobacterium sp.]|nr:hypothetical protein [Mycobacterium sp.]
MSNIERVRSARSITGRIAAGLVAALAIFPLAGAAIAEADVEATGGSGTTVDTDGTQGDLKPAVQGTQDSDGFQDAYANDSEKAVPQYTAR